MGTSCISLAIYPGEWKEGWRPSVTVSLLALLDWTSYTYGGYLSTYEGFLQWSMAR